MCSILKIFGKSQVSSFQSEYYHVTIQILYIF